MKKFLEPGLFEILKLLIGVQKKNRKEPAAGRGYKSRSFDHGFKILIFSTFGFAIRKY